MKKIFYATIFCLFSCINIQIRTMDREDYYRDFGYSTTDLPEGSYRNNESCRECRYNRGTNTLKCTCKNTYGREYPTSASGCQKYKNNNGRLECE